MSRETQDDRDIQRVLTSKSEVAAYYDKIAGVYDVLAEWPERRIREKGVEKLEVSAGDRVLEIGVGTGTSLVAFAARLEGKGDVFGLDLAERMLERARERIHERDLDERVHLVRGDAAKLPFHSAAVDALFMSFTLELFDTPEIPIVLSECRRTLREAGRMVVVSLSRSEPEGRATRAFEWTHRHFPNLLDCRPIHVAHSIETAGFRVEEAVSDRAWVPIEIVLARVSGDRPAPGKEAR